MSCIFYNCRKLSLLFCFLVGSVSSLTMPDGVFSSAGDPDWGLSDCSWLWENRSLEPVLITGRNRCNLSAKSLFFGIIILSLFYCLIFPRFSFGPVAAS